MLLIQGLARISLASGSSRVVLPAAQRYIATSRALRAEDQPDATPSPAAASAPSPLTATERALNLPPHLRLPGAEVPPITNNATTGSSAEASRSPFIMPGVEAAVDPRRQSPRRTLASRNQETYRLHIKASRNNILLTLATSTGLIVCRATGGSAGFKNAARSEYEAGYRATLSMFQKIEEGAVRWGMGGIEIVWNGFGKGREAAFRTLLTPEGQYVKSFVTSMRDATPLRVGGCRPKKKRML